MLKDSRMQELLGTLNEVVPTWLLWAQEMDAYNATMEVVASTHQQVKEIKTKLKVYKLII